jgi:hypothetical protein|tara:strand:+ start:6457 stop:6912 length:456 start_codon:yes stop_codon:yes gene_type:complete
MNFEEALNNKDYQMIMNKAASKFNNQLDKDEIHTCKLNALWIASETHDKERSKFTTYLYNGVRQQCISAVKFNSRYSKKVRPLHDNISDPRASGNLVDLYDEINSIPNGEMLRDRMLSNTIEEVANKHNCNRETARRKIKKSTNTLKQRLK